MIFHRSLSDSKSPQVSRTQHSGCSQQYCHLHSLYPSANFKSSSPFNNPLVIVPKAPTRIGTIVTFTFNSFFNSLARSWYLSFFHFPSELFCGPPTQQSRQFWKCSSFVEYYKIWVFWPGLGNPFVCRSPIGVYVCHFLGQVLGYYHQYYYYLMVFH